MGIENRVKAVVEEEEGEEEDVAVEEEEEVVHLADQEEEGEVVVEVVDSVGIKFDTYIHASRAAKHVENLTISSSCIHNDVLARR